MNTAAATGRRGFTLIELVVAIGLGVTILVIAVAAFRSIALAMGTLNRLSQQNQRMRSGFMTAMEDADFWHSAANPEMPWVQRYNSVAQVNWRGRPIADADIATKGRNGVNHRPFRPVRWLPWTRGPSTAAVADFNDTGAWSSDPYGAGAWSRSPVTPSPRPFGLIAMSGVDYWNDATGTAAKKSSDPQTWPNRLMFMNYPGIFTGDALANPKIVNQWFTTASVPYAPTAAPLFHWEPRLIQGDYTLVSSLDMAGGVAADGTISTAAIGKERPERILSVFRQLGLQGVVDYSPPGEWTIIQAADRFARMAPASDWATKAEDMYSVGELPWMFRTYAAMPATPYYLSGKSNAGGITDKVKNDAKNGNLIRPTATIRPWADREAYAGSLVPILYPVRMTSDVSGLIGSTGSGHSSGMPVIGCDFTALMRRRLMYYHGSIGRKESLFDGSSMNALAVMPLMERFNEGGGEIFTDRYNEYLKMFRNEIALSPALPNVEGAELSDASDAPSMTLRLRSLRLRDDRGQRYVGTVVVGLQETGKELYLPFTTIGSSFRGARQHWGQLRATRDANLAVTTTGDMGDSYVP
jgi:prepilin-type N-terminal cleavage/methylation domain-containing protein